MRQVRGARKNCIVVCGALLLSALPAWPANRCESCHPQEVKGYEATQMSHSLSRPKPGLLGKYFHTVSNTHFEIVSSKSGMIQRIGRGGASGEYHIPYAVGSGTHAFAYLIELNGHLFQSPLGYFPGRGWGMSPGYEEARAPDFDRPITPDCLFCHAGDARPVENTLNTYQDPPFEAEGITCERCHGPVEAHLKNPVPGSIINPANLAPRERSSVCEQCHLAGEDRVPNPGMKLSDFRAGMKLEDIYTVYVDKASLSPQGANPLQVVSQVQQLALSRCARESHDKLWCGTCHDPHLEPKNPVAYFRAKCLSCHGQKLLARHAKPNYNCIGCHMPRRPVSDGAHTVFTDHWIEINPPPAKSTMAGIPPPTELVAWHEPAGALAERNLGLADIKVGEQFESFPMVNAGFELLTAVRGKFPDDPAVALGIGKVFLVANDGAQAAKSFELLIQQQPDVTLNYFYAGLAQKELHDKSKAVAYLEKVIQLDPQLVPPYQELLDIYSADRDTEKVLETLQQYHRAFPQKLDAQQVLARARN
jgi:tetratricopeptide (TPR) repeat protein